jgi:hypothetical protein
MSLVAISVPLSVLESLISRVRAAFILMAKYGVRGDFSILFRIRILTVVVMKRSTSWNIKSYSPLKGN